MIYLNVEALLRMAARLFDKPPVIRDLGLLESAAARPRATAFGHDAYESLEVKAAALLESLCLNHALVDGNKRLAWTATVVFLDLNGHDLAADTDDAYDFVISVAEGRRPVQSTGGWIREHMSIIPNK